jgi:hypothetical protein
MNNVIDSKPEMVGSGKIYSNQIEAGKSVCEKLLDGPTHLTAGCQSGKTGVVIYAVNQFLNGFALDKSKILKEVDKDEAFNVMLSRTQIIWINARSDNYLRDQTEKRLIEAFGVNKILTRDSISRRRTLSVNNNAKKGKLIGKIYIGHLCDLQIDNNDNLVQLKNVIDENEPILLILDESHVGQDKFDRKVSVDKDGKITEYNVGVLDNFCKNLLGIHLTQPKDKWDNRRYLLSMSATRPSWSVYIEAFKENFGDDYVPNIVHLHPGKDYCGIAKDYDNVTKSRFVQAEPFYDKKTRLVSKQIIDEVKNLTVGKCILIRCKLQDSKEMIESLENMGFKSGEYSYRQCGINHVHGDADALTSYLKDCTEMSDEKTIIFIENFLGAGATFPNVRISAQFERYNKSNPTSHIQSVGRSFGYSDEYIDIDGNIKVFNKKDAKYKIYCDLEAMKLYQDGFNTEKPMFSDSALTTIRSRNVDGNTVWCCDIIPKQLGISVNSTLQKYYSAKFPDHGKNLKLKRKAQNNIRISYTSGSEWLDLNRLILNKQPKSDGESILNRVICIDGPNSKHNVGNEFFGYKNSYDELIENIKNGNNWLCKEFGLTDEMFEKHHICVYAYKNDMKSFTIKKDTTLSIT